MSNRRLQLRGLEDLGYWEDVCAGKEKPHDGLAEFLTKLRAVHIVAMSFSGVLTPPHVWLGEDGEKFFQCSQRDLLGVELLKKYGYRVMVVSNRRTKVVELRCRKMGVDFFTADDVDRDKGKKGVLYHVMFGTDIFESQIMYIGDDINDLEAMGMAGVAVATNDAHSKLYYAADYSTSANGGQHAVREIADILLMANGHELKL